MSDVRSTGSNATQHDGRTSRSRGFVTGTTEARPGIMTTEFWLTLIAAVTFVIAAYISDTFATDVGWALAAGVIAAYSLSRGFAKAGSREGPFMVRMGDREDDGR
jgi:hypothetical protein